MINTYNWAVDVGGHDLAPMRMQILHGEDVDMSIRVLQLGQALDTTGATATLYWQSADMGANWYSEDCTITDNVISTAWSHNYDTGKPRYIFYVRLQMDGVISYRIYGMISMLFSPNFIPNEVTLPTQVLDFAEVTLLNVPYVLTEDFEAHSGDTTTNPHGISNAMIGAYPSLSGTNLETALHPTYVGYLGTTLTVAPSGSYTWIAAGACTIGLASGWTTGKDDYCSLILTMSAGATLEGVGVTLVDAPTAEKVNHCFIRMMPSGVAKFFVAYVED